MEETNSTPVPKKKKSWKSTLLGAIAGTLIAVGTGNCAGLMEMIPADKQPVVGAAAGIAIALMGKVSKDDDK